MTSLPPVVMFVAKGFQRPDIPRARQEARSLVKAGYPVHVIAWDRYAEYPKRENVDGADILSFTLTNQRSFSKIGLAVGGLLFQIVAFFETLRLVNNLKQRPIIHAHDINTLLPSCILRVLRISSGLIYDCRELTYSVYSGWFNESVGSIMRTLEEVLLRYTDAMITVSDPIAKYLGRFKQNVMVVYNCPRISDIPSIAKSDARKQLGLPPDSFIVSYVGLIRYGCKLELLLSVASNMKFDNVHFVVVGDGPLAAEFRQAADNAKNPKVTVLPRVLRDRALMYVLASDLTWGLYDDRNVSLNVSMPWKLFESMACGVPVIVERGAFRAKFVEEHDCGVVLTRDDPDYIAEVIRSLAQDNPRRQRMSIAGKSLAESEYNWEAMSDKLVGIYATLHDSTGGAED